MFQREDALLSMFAISNHMEVSSIVIPQKNISCFGSLIKPKFLLGHHEQSPTGLSPLETDFLSQPECLGLSQPFVGFPFGLYTPHGDGVPIPAVVFLVPPFFYSNVEPNFAPQPVESRFLFLESPNKTTNLVPS